jgi:O-antigen/teichoic acid export membrane protein
MGVRRAFLWASFGRYLVMAINLAATLILARLLLPAEYGVTVLGGAVLALAEALRALGGGAYLIQKPELLPENIRACFTVSLVATVVIALALTLLAGPLATFFDMAQLVPYLHVAACGYLTGPFMYPIAALMSRNLTFGPIAMVSVVTATVNAAVSVSLAVRGFGYMSFAWGGAVSTAVGMLLYLYLWKDRSIFRPIFRHWGSVLKFGVFDSATSVLSQIADALPYFIFGKMFNAAAVGLSQRAVMLCLIPERVILAGVGAVALPAFSQQTRDGGSLKPIYLRALELITAAQWPSLLLLALLAHPAISILLGAQWLEAAPFVQILATALLFSFPLTLFYPTIVAVGAIRYMPLVVTLQSLVSLAVLIGFARHGLHAAILSTWVIFPWNGLVALLLARHFVGFRWWDLAGAIKKSLLVSLLSILGPAAMLLLYHSFSLPMTACAVAVVLSALGWFAGLRLTRHPLLDEILRIVAKLRAAASGGRIGELRLRFFGR